MELNQMLPRIRLKQILFITFTLIASLPVLILAGWVQQSALDKEISSVEEKHLLVARNLTGDLARYVIDVESGLNLVANNMIKSKDIDGVPEYLDSLYLRYVRITNSEGIIARQITAKSKTEKETEIFSNATLKLLLPVMKAGRENPGIVQYSDLVRTAEDETTFYLVIALGNEQFGIGALSTTHIIQAQQKISFGRRGHAAIVDRTGRAIAHPVPDWVKTMKDMSFLTPVQKMKKGETGVSKFFTPAMKADMVAGYSSVPRAGWGVMVPQPFEELEERANDVQFIALMIALIGIAISGLISWYIASILSEPIQSVVDAAGQKFDGSRASLLANVTTTRRFVPYELRVLLNSFNQMRNNLINLTSQLHSKIDLANAEVKSQNERLQEQSIELQETNKKLEQLICIDPLTGLFNRRHFDDVLGKEINYANRHKESFSLMMIDLDNFKSINDKYGHSVGDKLLCEVSAVITSKIRDSDTIFRVGGEEFAIICRHGDTYDVNVTTEIIRKLMEQNIILHHGKPVSVTASIGVVTYRADTGAESTQDELYRYADMAMYHSKKNGKNQTTNYADIAHVQDKDEKYNV